MAAGDEISIRMRLQGARQMAQQAKAAGQAIQDVGEDTVQAGSKARESARDFDMVGKAMTGLKKIGAGAGLAAGGALSAGLLSAVNADAANNKLSAQLGLTGPMSKNAGRIAGELYRGAYGTSIEQVNQALGAVMSSIPGMTGAPQAAIKALTGTALDFASAFDTDVEQAVASAGYVMEAGLAKSGTEAFDLLTAASSKVPAALRGELLETSEEYSQFFGALGYSGEEAFALLVDAAGKGRYGLDKVGDAIKEFTIRATDMSTTSKDAYQAIGLDAQAMSNKILAGGPSARDATQQIIQGLLSIKDPAKQAEAAIALFGTPIEDLNVADIPDFLKSMMTGSKSMEDFGGAAGRMGDAINQGPAYQFQLLKRGVETFLGTKILPFVVANKEVFGALALVIGTVLIAYGLLRVVTMAQAVATAVATAAQWLFGSSLFATRIGLAALAVQAGVMTAATWVHLTALRAWAWWQGLNLGLLARTTIAAIGQRIAMVAGAVAMGVVTVATGAWTAAQWLLNAAMAANPVTLIILAITALIAGFIWAYNNIEWFRKGVDRVWGGIKSGASDAWNWVKTGFTNLVSWLGGLPGRIGSLGSRMWSGIKDGFKAAINWIIRGWNSLRFGVPNLDLGPLGEVGGGTVGVPQIPYLAAGGVVGQTGPAVVGERGPEVVHLNRGAYVESNQAVASRGPDRVDVAGLAASVPNAPARRDERGVTLVVDGKVLAKITGRQVADQLARR